MNSVRAAYRVLLRAYPEPFRQRFGAEMERVFQDRWRDAQRRGRTALLVLTFRTLVDVLVNALAARASREERTPMNWQSLVMDARFAVRLFVRDPFFTLLAVGALALGIGANTAIFSIANAVLLKPLPYQDPERLAMVWSTNGREHREHEVVSPLDFLDFKKAASFSDVQAAFSFLSPAAMTGTGGAARLIVASGVTPGTFEMLGRSPVLGRTFTAQDAPETLVISHGFWTGALASDPKVVGRVLTIQGQPWTVLGVMPPDFVYPYKTMLGPIGFTRSGTVDAWLPIQFVAATAPRTAGGANLVRGVRLLSVVGRLKPGVTIAQANAELGGIARQLATAHQDTNREFGAAVVSLHDQTVGGLRPALALLLGGVAFVLLMACANLANLLLSRSAMRQREMAIRSALGAGRRRLIAQALTESLLLAVAGGGLALAAVVWGIKLIVALAPGDIPRIGEVHSDIAVLGFTAGLSIATGLVIGLLPAFAASRPTMQSTLTETGRTVTAGRGQRRVRSTLVVIEVSLAVVLTLGATLLLRSFLSVLSIDPGFRADNLLTLQIALPQQVQTADQRRAMYADLFSRLDAIPGVTATGGTTRLPLGSTNVTMKISVEGRNVPVDQWREVQFRRAVHDYFTAMAIPILRGRNFTAQDGPKSSPVVVINQTMAAQFFPGEDPVGKRVQLGPPPSSLATIIAVIGDVRHSALEAPPAPELYTWYLQNPPVNPFVVLRTSTDPASLATAVRAQVEAVSKDISAYDVRTMVQVRSAALAQRRFVLVLVGAFGALALVMAAVGVYGVMALIVSERTPEIGIRLALGAAPSQVLRAIVRQGMSLAGAGVVIGLAGAAAAAPLLSTQVYGIRTLDPVTLAGVPTLLLIVAIAACVLPARRAMSIDPVDALRG